MQSNRLAAPNKTDRDAGNWTRIDELKIPNNTPVVVWLKDLECAGLVDQTTLYKQRQSGRLQIFGKQ